MNATTLVNALRRHREGLASRWCKQFADNRVSALSPAVELRKSLALAFVDEVTGLLASDGRTEIPRRHRGRAFAELAPFPENVAVCIDAFQAGTQVLGAFVVENAGPFAAWSVRMRNRFLGEIDAVFHILVHREIEALCEERLDTPVDPVAEAPMAPGAASLRPLPLNLVSNN